MTPLMSGVLNIIKKGELVNTNSLGVIIDYHRDLSDKYPKQYYNAYQEQIL